MFNHNNIKMPKTYIFMYINPKILYFTLNLLNKYDIFIKKRRVKVVYPTKFIKVYSFGTVK